MLGKKRIINSDTIIFVNICTINVLSSRDTERIVKLRREIEEFIEYNTNYYNELENSQISNKEELSKELSINIDNLKRVLHMIESSSGKVKCEYINPDLKGFKSDIFTIDEFLTDNNTIIK